MTGHHLIMGTLTDILTGRSLEDTHDERYRQQLAGLLLQKGYDRKEIEPRVPVLVRAGARRARVPVDFLVRIDGRPALLVRYGPGSVVTRHRPALALGRLVAPHPVPVVVVTNGRDADILSGVDGRVLASGLEAVPDRADLAGRLKSFHFAKVSAERAEREARIAYAYEVDDGCPCDDTVCRLPDAETA